MDAADLTTDEVTFNETPMDIGHDTPIRASVMDAVREQQLSTHPVAGPVSAVRGSPSEL